MADKLDGSAIVENTIPSNRIQENSITQNQLQSALYTNIIQATQPKIRSLSYPGDDTAANTGGGDTIVVNGSGFGSSGNVQIYINGNAVSSITVTNANSVSFTAPALSAATYPLYLINTTDGSVAILIPGIQYSGTPTWTTTTPLTTQDASIAWNIQLIATSDSAVSYSLQAGSSLPSGIALAANGLISGTMTSPPTDETTYNFTVVATDLEQQDASRAFSVSVTVAALDPFFTYTTLLLHGDGTNNANNHAFVDSSNNNFAITRNGNATQGSFSPFGNNWSVYGDGNGDFLSLPSSSNWAFGTGDFTIEAWLYWPSAQYDTVFNYFIGNNNSNDDSTWGFGVSPSTKKLSFSNWNTNLIIGNGIVPHDQWVHVALTRSSSVLRTFINGTLDNSASDSTNLSGTTALHILKTQYTTLRGFTGYISNVRILKGTALYTAAFTPPTSPLTAVSNTSLLTCQSNRFIDNSANNFTITPNGDARVTKFDPFVPSAKYSAATNGGSGYFDGSGDWLSFGAQTAFNCGTATDFCMEAWVYRIGSTIHIWAAHQAAVADGFYFTTSGFNVYSGGGGGAGITSLSKTIPAYAWSHCVLTRQNDRLRYFLNGELIGTSTSSVQVNTDGRAVGINGGVNFTGDAGYIATSRFIKGSVPLAYNTSVTTTNTQIFIPPTSVLTTTSQNANSAQVIALVNYTNAGIIDSVGKNVLETVGDARVNTAIKKFGTGSMYFDGTGDYLSSRITPDAVFGSGDMTFECWIYPNTISGIDTIYDTRTSGSYGNESFSFQLNDGIVQVWAGSYSSSVPIIASVSAVATNTWTFIAFSRIAGVNKLFINGIQVASNSTSWTQTIVSTNLYYIGQTVGIDRPFNGHIDDLRITKGIGRYRYNFTPPTKAFNDGDGNLATLTSDVLVGDQVNTPVFPYTTLLLPGNGTNNQNNHTFLDSSNNNFTITRNGNATQGTFSPFSQTGWSNYFDGTGDYFSGIGTTSSFNFMHQSNALWTFECWLYTTSSSNQYLLDNSNGTTNQTGVYVGIESSKLIFTITRSSTGTWVASGSSTDNVPINQWVHLAITYDQSLGSNNGKFYINGVASGTVNKTANAPSGSDASNAMRVGAFASGSSPVIGYLSNLRITNSIEYSAAFTPPTSPLTAIANTSLLTCQSNRFIDNSNNAFTLTRNGDVSVQAFSPFAPSANNSAATNGGSGYFDGTGDYLTAPDDAFWDLSSSTGSMELFVYPTAAPVNTPGLIGQCPTTANWSSYLYSDGRIGVGIQGTSEVAAAAGSLIVAAWNHIVITRDNSAGRTRIFVNGVLKATGTGTYFNNSSAALHIGYFNGYAFNGYISDVRFCKGSIPTTYQTSSTTVDASIFTPPSSPVTTSSQGATSGDTELLLSSTNAGIADATGKNVLETVGDAQISTAQSKFGGSSMYFDGTGDYLAGTNNALNDLGTGDFTIEFWLYVSSNPAVAAGVVTKASNSGNTGYSVIYYPGYIGFVLGSGSASVQSAASSISTTTWTHVAITRFGTSGKIFINGTQSGSTGTINNFTNSTTVIAVGALNTATGWNANYGFNGYIDDLRITKGIARYTQNFTPPTSAFLLK